MNTTTPTAELPSRKDVLAALGRERHRIQAVYDETGARVHLKGRHADAAVSGGAGLVRCSVCDAPSGEVTLMHVATSKGRQWVCFAGDCAGQRTKAILRQARQNERLLRRVSRRPTDGREVRAFQKPSGAWTAELTISPREVARRKQARALAAASKRANRPAKKGRAR